MPAADGGAAGAAAFVDRARASTRILLPYLLLLVGASAAPSLLPEQLADYVPGAMFSMLALCVTAAAAVLLREASGAPAGGRGWFRAALGFDECGPAGTRRALRARAGAAADETPTLNGHRVGQWLCVSVGELRRDAAQVLRLQQQRWEKQRRRGGDAPPPGAAGVRVSHVVGNVARLHEDAQYAGALFQAASGFNCLEMPDPRVTPDDGVTGYVYDKTQGPACAMSCAAATAWRNYLMPLPAEGMADEGAVVEGQSAATQLNTLDGLSAALDDSAGQLWRVRNGYSSAHAAGLAEAARRIDAAGDVARLRDTIRVGAHFDATVTAPGAPAGQRVGQVFCAAHAIGYSATPPPSWEALARLTLEAEYEGALWVAVLYAEWRRQRELPVASPPVVLLTKLGGGVFGNPHCWIVEAIEHACAQLRAAGADLDVRLVHYGDVDAAYEGIE